MGEITRGLRAVLSYPRVYDLFQGLMGKRGARSSFSSRYIRARAGDRILDIGCGTADMRNYLPDVEYYAIDPNPAYIEAAKRKLGGVAGCRFMCAALDDAVLDTLPKFDIVLATGVLHHLNDAEAARLAGLARAALTENGRLVTLDPCLVAGQSGIARFLILRDRGQHVRDVDGYRALMSPVFDSVTVDIRHDLGRLPYTHLVMECLCR